MPVHIQDLPTELLLAIFSWIPSRSLIATLPAVCRQFRDVLSSEWYWRSHYTQLCRSQPAKELPSVQQWQEGCLHADFGVAARNDQLRHSPLTDAFGGLNCVHILHPDLSGASSVTAAGARNSTIYLWRRRSSGGRANSEGGRCMREFTGTTLPGHKGWVWTLTSDRKYRPQLLYSGAWDHKIMLWDVSVAKNIEIIRGVHKAAVLSLHIPQRDTLVSASQDKNVRMFDIRTPISVQFSHKQHTRSVLSVASTERYIYSSSEDRTVCVWDWRAQKELQRIKLQGIIPSLHLEHDILSLACNSLRPEEEEVEPVKVHEVFTYDCSHGTLQNIMSFDTGHLLDVTKVIHTLGTVITGSKDGTVRIHSAGSTPHCFAVVEQHSSAVSGVDYSRDSLAIVSGDSNVSLWTNTAGISSL